MNNAKRAALVLAVTGAAIGVATGTACAHDGATAVAKAVKSPGFISGNIVQVPVDVPIQVVGNTFNGGGLLNPAIGNSGVVR